ncbi:two pore domain potassium channel family protein [Oceanobacillus sp. 143]|uniref:Potassium channel domain-containing protein n=1 Tax=Oceanobacillus zhaokaii TaxID=2052660 RepID=A0A345PEI8_9BACI|nr:potassium channel family protein [Oceanobacillus zhaokaii]AXI08418.1 hypothetical protein CUC15_05495 [Oceanobacillus zhaokaii]QGS68285.1 two pore domain potassium channel family protein [Oceanobacillus sp. 143]
MNIIPWFVFVIVCILIYISIHAFIKGETFPTRFEMRDSRFSGELFIVLLITYSLVIIGFGILYFILSFQGIILVEDGELRQVNVIGSIIHSMYFSGVTMLTIGYGDITPIGIGRFIALIEALIGYILPTAFVMRLFQMGSRSRDK